eukprot:TRINITY_DN23327_c0_g1_i3.p1 TRINITY_DN23327_c0_g1~~TRINITY_DN23327_c0_g1_i3.p1  ORF type:complete len:384 (+),score=50.08 TRINITY_DN23327_c0_g1_i3:96-1247(+)
MSFRKLQLVEKERVRDSGSPSRASRVRIDSTLAEIYAEATDHESRFAQAKEKDPDLLNKVVAVAYLHHLLFNGRPVNVIAKYMDPEVASEVQRLVKSPLRLAVGVVGFAIVVTMLPIVYARFLMKDPCQPVEVMIDEHKRDFSQVSCDVQSFMKSWWSLTLAPISLFIIVLAWALGPLWQITGIRRMFKPMKIAAYNWVRRDAPTLWYQPFSLEGRTLALTWTIGLWSLLLVEFVIVAMLVKEGLALVVAVALGQLLLDVANKLFAPADELISVIDAELAAPDDTDLKDIMKQLFKTSRSCIYMTSTQLNAIYNMPNLRNEVEHKELYWFGFKDLDEKFRFRALTVSQLETPVCSVFISDMNIVVPLVDPRHAGDSSSSSEEP